MLIRGGQGAALGLLVFVFGLPFAMDPRISAGREVLAYGTHMFVTSVLAFAWFGARLGKREAQLSEALCRADRACTTDPMTGLKNARYFRRRLQEACAEASRGSLVSLVIFDLDDFKKVNDQHGHAIGDFALRLSASALGATTRAGDTAARVGGEELALILPHTDSTHAKLVAERVLQEIRCRARDLPAGVKLTASAGVATARGLKGHDPISARALFRRADAALYDAKRSGKDRTVVHQPSSEARSELRIPETAQVV
ncbi:MAG: GGDEF domain-containing protein [Deltaproteobacteria bacterium]|nr:GGDEF domain-containing protein [Deltaproteobacteria bacterium]